MNATDDGTPQKTSSKQVSVIVTDVNEAPRVAPHIPNQTLSVGDSKDITLTTWFRDPDGDTLVYSANSSDPAVATAGLSSGTLTLTPAKSGSATITVRAYDRPASDPARLGTSQSFAVTVTLPKLPTPTIIDVLPLPLRKAKLTWTEGTDDNYIVEIQQAGGNWSSPHQVVKSAPPLRIDLDEVMPNKGLANHPAYEIRVKEVSYSTDYLDSAYSDVVRIVDNPLLLSGGSANGNSPSNGNGQAVLKWARVTNATEYTVSYRLLGKRPVFPWRDTPHSNPDWPNHEDWPYYSVDPLPQHPPVRPPTGGHPSIGSAVSTTVSGLDKGEIYAFQVNYKMSDGTTVLSARDAYVWPSATQPGDGGRVATYTFFGHHPNRTFEYIICKETFPDDPTTPDNERDDWVDLIKSAFGQWAKSTDQFITMTPRVHGEDGWRCSDPNSPISTFIQDDDERSEVRMLDVTLDVGVDDETDISNIWSFPEVKSDVFKSCLIPRAETDSTGKKTGTVLYTSACVTLFSGYSGFTSQDPEWRSRITELV